MMSALYMNIIKTLNCSYIFHLDSLTTSVFTNQTPSQIIPSKCLKYTTAFKHKSNQLKCSKVFTYFMGNHYS